MDACEEHDMTHLHTALPVSSKCQECAADLLDLKLRHSHHVFSQKIHRSLLAGDAYVACMGLAACVHMIQEDAVFRLPRRETEHEVISNATVQKNDKMLERSAQCLTTSLILCTLT